MSKTLFITGTTSGFGKSTVELFASKGWNVAATYRGAEHRELFAAYPNVRMYELDVRDTAQVPVVVERVLRDFGSVDVLVNNAGHCLFGSFEASSEEQIRVQFDTNVFGLMAVTRAFLPHFRARRAGMIFNISSSSGLSNYPFVSVYGASKAAVRAFSESLFIELAPFGIKVKTIFPGLHATRIFTKLDPAVGEGREVYAPYVDNFTRMQGGVGNAGAPEQIAETIWQAVAKDDDRRDYVVNRDAKLLKLMARWMPEGLWKKMNLAMIARKPSKALMAMTRWQVNGTKHLQFDTDTRMIDGTPASRG